MRVTVCGADQLLLKQIVIWWLMNGRWILSRVNLDLDRFLTESTKWILNCLKIQKEEDSLRVSIWGASRFVELTAHFLPCNTLYLAGYRRI